ncbi:hypothetical protein I2486_12680 [Cellulophaga sp. E16_2]|uniref:Uncharacterized protein n=1 Tax=Cellulophaga algicola (strain DSM 14237 / IC166 / ACAM 630) TaxID=688270 RepID=E6XAF7_CELAD|nr:MULTISPECIES: hypothetical protein [Cellulophaga]ADV49873.1 hypothetical protein Celal_2587 [Cellulophaga algicola DSM 14237]MBO0592256.1 hypothetical protein [Cellulophaga sp. E16_2]
MKNVKKRPVNKTLYLSQVLLKANRLKMLSIAFVSAVFFLGVNVATAQEDQMEEDNYKAFNASGHLKNMHTWHGFVVHPGAVFATSLEYKTRNQKFTLGVWGGASLTSVDVINKDTGAYVNANYKEFSMYSSYHFSDKFFIEAVSHNNYTGVEERGDKLQYWSYDKTQGYNFVDLNFGYTIADNTLLYFATILGGGSGDYEVQTNGSLRNSWTHYFEVKSKVWEKEDYKLSVFAGGAWSFINDTSFYTEGVGNIINVGATLGKNINFGNYKMPVEVTAMWNPEKEKTVLQLDIMLF